MRKMKVYNDGQCGFCMWAQRMVESWDEARVIEFRDYNKPEIAAETPFSYQELDAEIRVQGANGQWYSGFYGWIAILAALPRGRELVQILSAAPACWIGPIAYGFVAGHRDHVPRLLLRWIGAPDSCEGRCSISGRVA